MKKLFFVLTEQDSMFRILAGENGMWRDGVGGGARRGNWFEQRGDFHLTIYDPPRKFGAGWNNSLVTFRSDAAKTLSVHLAD